MHSIDTYIISLEAILGAFSIHIIYFGIGAKIKTILVPIINSPDKMKDIRQYLEQEDYKSLALWFKREYSLTHAKITISLGPEIYNWLVQYQKMKRTKYDHIQNFNRKEENNNEI